MRTLSRCRWSTMGVSLARSQSTAARPSRSPTARPRSPDLRRPGVDRHRERAAVQGAQGGIRRSTRPCSVRPRPSNLACDKPGADRRSAGVRDDRGKRHAVFGAWGARTARRGYGLAGGGPSRPRQVHLERWRTPCRPDPDSLWTEPAMLGESRPACGTDSSGAATMGRARLLEDGSHAAAPRPRRVSGVARACSDAREVELIKTFADQAVIAMENVRLFKELQASKRELTTALDHQTATSDILGVISRSLADVQPVFEAIAENAARLVQAWSVTVLRWDGEFIHLAAERGGPPGSGQRLRDKSPWLPNTTSGPGRCIATGTVIHVPEGAARAPRQRLPRATARESRPSRRDRLRAAPARAGGR